MNYEITLCEDDAVQNENLVSWLQEHFSQAHVCAFTSGHALIDHVRQHPAKRIILMDIMLDEGASGIEAARTIKTIDPGCVIVFLSSFLEKACDVYEVDHCYFVYKPQKEKRLEPALKKALSVLMEKPRSLIAHAGACTLCIDPGTSVYLARIKRYTLSHCIDQTYKVKEDLENLQEQLPGTFSRCHRSFLVNFRYVRSYMVHDLEMKNDKLIPVSRRYVQPVRKAFHQYLSSI